MTKNCTIVALLILSAWSLSIPAQAAPPPTPSLLSTFCSAEWSRVQKIGLELKVLQADSIDALLQIMQDEREVPLHDTFDLIYPGATTFYGHGGVVNYELNWLPARAGWILEDLTFQDFGFSGGVPQGDKLLKKTIDLKIQGKGDVSMEEVAPQSVASRRLQKYQLAAAKAKTWWGRNRTSWTRRHALQEALASTSPARQGNALQYLRYPDSPCPGLSLATYNTNLLPLVVHIAKTGKKGYEGPRDQACLLLSETPTNRQFSIQGVRPGTPRSKLPKGRFTIMSSLPAITGYTRPVTGTVLHCDRGQVLEVEGAELWEDGKPILKRGDDCQAIGRKLTPLSSSEVLGEFIGCKGQNCEVVLELDEKTRRLVNVKLYPTSRDSQKKDPKDWKAP